MGAEATCKSKAHNATLRHLLSLYTLWAWQNSIAQEHAEWHVHTSALAMHVIVHVCHTCMKDQPCLRWTLRGGGACYAIPWLLPFTTAHFPLQCVSLNLVLLVRAELGLETTGNMGQPHGCGARPF